MCMGCMSNAEFVVAGGALGVGGVRLGLRALLPSTPSFLRKGSDDVAAAFVATRQPARYDERSSAASVDA